MSVCTPSFRVPHHSAISSGAQHDLLPVVELRISGCFGNRNFESPKSFNMISLQHSTFGSRRKRLSCTRFDSVVTTFETSEGGKTVSSEASRVLENGSYPRIDGDGGGENRGGRDSSGGGGGGDEGGLEGGGNEGEEEFGRC